MLLIRIIAEAGQNLIVGKAVDLLATHFKVGPVCATSAATMYHRWLKSLGLAPPAHFRRRKSVTSEFNIGRANIRRGFVGPFNHRDCIMKE